MWPFGAISSSSAYQCSLYFPAYDLLRAALVRVPSIITIGPTADGPLAQVLTDIGLCKDSDPLCHSVSFPDMTLVEVSNNTSLWGSRETVGGLIRRISHYLAWWMTNNPLSINDTFLLQKSVDKGKLEARHNMMLHFPPPGSDAEAVAKIAAYIQSLRIVASGELISQCIYDHLWLPTAIFPFLYRNGSMGIVAGGGEDIAQRWCRVGLQVSITFYEELSDVLHW